MSRVFLTSQIIYTVRFFEDIAKLFKFEIAALCEGEHPILPCPLLCTSHYPMLNDEKVDSVRPNFRPQSEQLSLICKVKQNPH